jgi:hypothetical protein
MNLPTKDCLLENNMHRLLKALSLTLALAAFSVFTAGCGSGNTAQVRFVNAIQDTQDYGSTGLDIDFNGNKVFTDITYDQFSASTYSSVPSGNPTIAAFQTGSTPPANQVFSQAPPLGLNGGSQYTMVATGFASGGGSDVVILAPTDNNTEPANGSVNFRVINASPSGPNGSEQAVDVYILQNPNNGIEGQTPTFSNLAYKNTTSYIPLPINTANSGWELFVTITGSGTPYINAPITNFGSSTEGSICTLVLTDIPNGDEMNFTPIFLNDLNGCSN